MEQPSVQNPDQLRDAAAAAVAPDPATADLLAKYAKGEKLTPQENGKLSWVGRKFPWLAEKFGVTTKPAQSASETGGTATVGAGASAATSDHGLAGVEIDAGFAERTTTALLRRSDAIAQRAFGNAARDAGAPPELVARFERAAAMSSDDKKLMAELVPACCQSAGMDLRKFPFWIAGGVLGLYVTDLALLMHELREMKREREQAEPKPPKLPANSPANTPVLLMPDPPRPSGAPGVIT